MEKLKKREMILYDSRRIGWNDNTYKWGQIKDILKKKNIELQDDDEMSIFYEDSYVEGDSARDACYTFQVYRTREETDEEFEKRKIQLEKSKEDGKKRRYENYIKLKAEFEPENMIKNSETDPYNEEIWEI